MKPTRCPSCRATLRFLFSGRVVLSAFQSFLVISLFASPALAQDVTWTNAGSGSWDTAGNWSGGVLPTDLDTTVIDNSGTATLAAGVEGTYSNLYTGSSSAGTISVSGGVLNGSTALIGMEEGSHGTATVSSGTWFNASSLNVGVLGTGDLNVSGGSVLTGGVLAGYFANSHGTVTVSGGTLTNVVDMFVAYQGTGVLNVNGGAVFNASAFLGADVGANGAATVSSGTWSSSGDLWVGHSGTAALNVNGGLVSVSGTVFAANNPDSTGTVTLGGSSGNRGVLSVNQIQKVSGGGTLSFDGGVLQARSSQNDFVSGYADGDVIIGGGGAFVDSNGFDIGIAAPLSGTGVLTKQGEGTLTLSGGNSYSGGTVVKSGTLTATNNIAVGTGTVAVEGGVFHIADTVDSLQNDTVLTSAAGSVRRDLLTGALLADAIDVRSDLDGGTDTAAKILAGGASSTDTTLAAGFKITSLASNDQNRKSDVFRLDGVPVVSGSETDVFVLELSIGREEPDSFLGWLDSEDEWVNAVDGNFNNTATAEMMNFQGSFDEFQAAFSSSPLSECVGAWGVDVDGGVTSTWAVLNHNSEFAVVAVPEPATGALLAVCGLVVLVRRRR